MVVTVPFDLIFSIWVGLLFAACAREQFADGAAPWGRELAAVLLFEGIVLWPVAIYYYTVYPDWSWMYFVDPHRLPWGVSALVMLAYVATLLGGYLAGWAIVRAHRPKLLNAAIGGVGFAVLLFLILSRGRLLANGTFAQYHAGHAPSAVESKLLWALGVTGVGVATAIAFVGFSLWEQGKRFRA